MWLERKREISREGFLVKLKSLGFFLRVTGVLIGVSKRRIVFLL